MLALLGLTSYSQDTCEVVTLVVYEKIECPTCKAKIVDDLGEIYLSYPTVGDNIKRYIKCENCGSKYELPATIKSMSITLDIDESSMRKYF